MELALQIVGIIALLAFTFLCLQTVDFFKNAKELIRDASVSLDKMNNTLEEVKDAVIPALKTIEDTKDHIVSLTNNIEKQLVTLSEIAEPLADGVQVLYQKIAQPISYIGHLLTSVSKALDTFKAIVGK